MGEAWAAMIVAEGELPPESDQLKGITLFGPTAEEAENAAKSFLGSWEPAS
jgi:hypothetical protein